MIYKNGIKEWALMCCGCGLVYGALAGFVENNITIRIISGIIFGVLFTLCMATISKHIEKKSELLRAEISKARKIICEGPANQKKGLNTIGGWLFLSEDAIEFYPHRMNIGGQNIPILLDDISNVEAILNILKIHTKTNETFTFLVSKANLWKRSINILLGIK